MKTNQFAFAMRRAGSLLGAVKLWSMTGINGCSGHKMATITSVASVDNWSALKDDFRTFLSAFCHGLRNAVRTGWLPISFVKKLHHCQISCRGRIPGTGAAVLHDDFLFSRMRFSRELKALTTHPRRFRSDVIMAHSMARTLIETLASSPSPRHSFCECTRF
jgi:hypothetical protein